MPIVDTLQKQMQLKRSGANGHVRVAHVAATSFLAQLLRVSNPFGHRSLDVNS
jgi:hypothetical protein